MGNNINSIGKLVEIKNKFLNNIKEKIDDAIPDNLFGTSNSNSNIDFYEPLEKPEEDSDKSFGLKIKDVFISFINNLKESINNVLNKKDVAQSDKVENKDNNEKTIDYSAKISKLYASLAESTFLSQQDSIKAEKLLAQTQQEQEIMEKLYDDLSKATTKEERDKILADINNFQSVKEQEKLNNEIKDLYLKLSEAGTEAERDSIQAQIDLLLAQQKSNVLNDLYSQLDKAETKEEREQIEFEIKLQTLNNEFESNLSYLYDKLSNATSDSQKDSINAEIAKVKAEQNHEYLSFLYESLASATSEAQCESIKTKIINFQFDVKTQEFNEQRDELYEQLANTTNSADRDRINAQILLLNEQSAESYLSYLEQRLENSSTSEQRESIQNSIDDFKYTKGIGDRIRSLQDKLNDNTLNQSERHAINAQIDALRAESDQHYLTSLQNDLKNAKTETEKYLIQKEIQDFEYQRALEAKTKDLINKQKNATNEAEFAFYEQQIQSQENLINDRYFENALNQYTNSQSYLGKADWKSAINNRSQIISINSKIENLNEMLVEVTSSQERNAILSEINSLKDTLQNLK